MSFSEFFLFYVASKAVWFGANVALGVVRTLASKP